LYGLDVFCAQQKKLLVAVPEKSFNIPFRNPEPEPSITTSMNIPQNTPKHVRNVLSLFFLMVANISCQESASNIGLVDWWIGKLVNW
jgi:hypothetical protein